MFNFVLYLLIVFIVASAASDIHIEAIPSNVSIGVTRYLDVKCFTTKESASTMESLISLIISRSTNPQDKNFKELASLTMFTPEVQVKDISEVNMTVSGNINNNGESYIQIIWEYPDATKMGVYQCEAHGVDHTGHPVYFNSTTLVSSTNSDVEPVSEQIKALTLLIEQLNTKVNNLTSSENMLRFQLDSWKQLVEKAKMGLFKISPVYNGKTYLLSGKFNTLAAADAETSCNLFGGYLAEVDSEEEHNFLIQQVLGHHTNYDFYLISATDEGHENIWINRHSNAQVTYIKWSVGQPNLGTAQNCLCLYPPTWHMDDTYCAYTDSSFTFGYICEVPESTHTY